MTVTIEISVGELADRLTILRLKLKNARNDDVRRDIDRQIKSLQPLLDNVVNGRLALLFLIDELSEVNMVLWHLEDKIRAGMNDPNLSVTSLLSNCVKVPEMNDRRASIKRKIDEFTHSELRDHKNYNGVQP